MVGYAVCMAVSYYYLGNNEDKQTGFLPDAIPEGGVKTAVGILLA